MLVTESFLNPLIRNLRSLLSLEMTEPGLTEPDTLQTPTETLKKHARNFARKHRLARGTLLACAAAFAIRFGIRLLSPAIFTDDRGETVYWPVDGVLTAVMLMVPRADWPWLLLGSFVSQLEAMAGQPVPVILADSVGNLVEPIIAACSLPHFENLSDWMERPNLSLKFVFGAVLLSSTVAASIYGLVLTSVYHQSFWAYASKWSRADLLGMTMALPLVLVLCSGETYRLFHPRAITRTILILGATCAVSWSVFRWTSHPIAFAILPLLLLIVFQLGFSGAVIAVNLVTVIVSSLTVRGFGPFSSGLEASQPFRIPILQLFLTMAMLISFPVGIVLKQRKRLEVELNEALLNMKYLASNDALTGIANRRQFDQSIEEERRRSIRTGQSLALLMIDVDFFKTYNDFYGHVLGDECLRRIANAICSVPSRTGDLIARYGGEEFVVVLPNSSIEAAAAIAARIVDSVLDMRIEHRGSPHQLVTVSIGCGATSPEQGWESTELIKIADRALYGAKYRGRNCIETLSSHHSAEDLEGHHEGISATSEPSAAATSVPSEYAAASK